jgi:hypothetical protein
MGSVVLGLWVGPAIRRIAADHDLRTLGDFLEWRYDWRVRAISSALLWIGTVAILGGQLLALSRTLEAVAGWPRWIGAVTPLGAETGCCISHLERGLYRHGRDRATIKQQLDLHQHMGDAIENLLHIALRLHCIRRPRLGH